MKKVKNPFINIEKECKGQVTRGQSFIYTERSSSIYRMYFCLRSKGDNIGFKICLKRK